MKQYSVPTGFYIIPEKQYLSEFHIILPFASQKNSII